LPSCAIKFIAGHPSASAVMSAAVDFFMVVFLCPAHHALAFNQETLAS
jgi:hypothetical protein